MDNTVGENIETNNTTLYTKIYNFIMGHKIAIIIVLVVIIAVVGYFYLCKCKSKLNTKSNNTNSNNMNLKKNNIEPLINNNNDKQIDEIQNINEESNIIEHEEENDDITAKYDLTNSEVENINTNLNIYKE